MDRIATVTKAKSMEYTPKIGFLMPVSALLKIIQLFNIIIELIQISLLCG